MPLALLGLVSPLGERDVVWCAVLSGSGLYARDCSLLAQIVVSDE